jgi:hypothetical protein
MCNVMFFAHFWCISAANGAMVKKSHHLFCYFCSDLQHHTCILCYHSMKY